MSRREDEDLFERGDAFAGAVQRLLSTVSQLWLIGVSAIDALGNIATVSGVTTFSVTNAVGTLGSPFGDRGYFSWLIRRRNSF